MGVVGSQEREKRLDKLQLLLVSDVYEEERHALAVWYCMD